MHMRSFKFINVDTARHVKTLCPRFSEKNAKSSVLVYRVYGRAGLGGG